MEKYTLWKRLRKHYILLLVGSLFLLLLIFLGVYRVMHSYRATPIAHISPGDSLQTTTLPGKLERYKKELIEQEKEAYKRKVALDEIVSMDFSQNMKNDNFPKPKESGQPANGREGLQEKETTTPAIGSLQQHTSAAKPVQKKNKLVKDAVEVKKAEDGFYTIKPDSSKAATYSFIKALIHGNQKVKPGGTVCLRLLESVSFGNHTYPKNTILYGRIRGGMSGRVQITISGTVSGSPTGCNFLASRGIHRYDSRKQSALLLEQD